MDRFDSVIKKIVDFNGATYQVIAIATQMLVAIVKYLHLNNTISQCNWHPKTIDETNVLNLNALQTYNAAQSTTFVAIGIQSQMHTENFYYNLIMETN